MYVCMYVCMYVMVTIRVGTVEQIKGIQKGQCCPHIGILCIFVSSHFFVRLVYGEC